MYVMLARHCGQFILQLRKVKGERGLTQVLVDVTLCEELNRMADW